MLRKLKIDKDGCLFDADGSVRIKCPMGVGLSSCSIRCAWMRIEQAMRSNITEIKDAYTFRCAGGGNVLIGVGKLYEEEDDR